jgi:hypothetical protein
MYYKTSRTTVWQKVYKNVPDADPMIGVKNINLLLFLGFCGNGFLFQLWRHCWWICWHSTQTFGWWLHNILSL